MKNDDLKMVSFWIERDQKLQLDLHAAMTGLKKAEVVRKAIAQYLKREASRQR